VKKIILISAALVSVLMLSGAGFVGNNIGKNPFIDLVNDVNALETQVSGLSGQVNGLQSQINAITPLIQDVNTLEIQVSGQQLQINTIIAALPAVQSQSFNAFLFVEGIPGEVKEAPHIDWIGVQSYSMGVSGGASQPGVGASPQFTDFVIVHPVDKASAKLALACCIGTLIPEVKLELWRPTGDKSTFTKYMEYKFNNVLISSVKPSGSSHGDEIPTEQVTFNYEKIEWTYTPADGNSITTGWDVKNKQAL
jgi:type VI secretion system secreted protein Hcp